MPYCLGLHIDNNFIKYAKVLNEKDKNPKVETFGVVCYENLDMAIENILKETSTFSNTEISTNLKGEFYNYFEVFSGMAGTSLKRNLELEFQTEVCPKLNITPASVQSKYIVNEKKFDKDTEEVIYISANKTDINDSKKIVKGKVKKILPISLANISLLDVNEKSNFAILNIDSLSTLTIVLQGKLKKVVSINIGMSNILAKLNQKYNSYAKSYEKCKSIILYNDNTTKDLVIDVDDTEDVENITPMLYDIGQRVNTALEEFQGMVNKVYITGDAVIINNIDLYFEGLLGDIKCEILKPQFIMNNPNISNKIKDYTEVNSAIALAITKGTIGDKSINFSNNMQSIEAFEAIKDNKVVQKISSAINKIKEKINIKNEEENPYDKRKINFSIGNSTLILQLVLWILVFTTYILASNLVSKQYADNTSKLNSEITNINSKTMEVESDTRMVTTAKIEYDELIDKIATLNAQLLQVGGTSYDVPRLMDNIAMVIPDKVLVTNISINSQNRVSISAQCETSAELGFFVSRLKNEEVMKNITTTIETESSNIKKITIMGEII